MIKKKLLSLALLIAMLMTTLVVAAPLTASAYDNTYTFTINGTNTTPPSGSHNKVYLYTNTTGSTKTINCNDAGTGYNFRDSKVMIFDANGRIIECGGNLTSATSPITGAAQLYLYIPAGGFMIAFGSNNTNLMKMYNVVMEGAMLYNSTMSVIYEAYASYSGSTLTVKYNNPVAPSANAKKFLFIGNSTTYFNGGPIKFKAMAAAAGIEVDVTYCTRGSAYLSYFVDETRDGLNGNEDHNKALKEALAAKKYDYVVLQDAAKADYYTTRPSVDKLLPLIEANGAKAVLYMRYSAATTLAQIIANAEKHHHNYATLAKEYALDVARVADAFIYAKQSISGVQLYASDGGHHSKEGSYLMAATWLYEFLGVDPVGNSYTAQMSTSLATQLQQCAKKACEEEYVWPVTQTTYSASNGTSYNNIAAGKDYVPTGGQYSDYRWTDSFPDYSIRGKLTDGKSSTAGDDNYIGTYGGNGHTLTIDLGGVSEIKAIKTDLFGSAWGITDPGEATINVSISNAGEVFTDVGTLTAGSETAPGGDWKKRIFSKEFAESLNARYVRLSYSGTNYAWSSEIEVFGVASDLQLPDTPLGNGNLAYQQSYTASGLYADENGNNPYPDENGTSLTDGRYTVSTGEFDDTGFAAFHRSSDFYATNGYAAITVDLGKYYAFDEFDAYVASDYHSAAGIVAPSVVSVYVSTDGSKWRKAGDATIENSTTEPTAKATLVPASAIGGRYVQYRFVCVENLNWIMVAEVEAYGEESEELPIKSTTGDLNGNDQIDAFDYALQKRLYFGTYAVEDNEVADINGNGQVDAFDYALLKRAYFGTYVIN